MYKLSKNKLMQKSEFNFVFFRILFQLFFQTLQRLIFSSDFQHHNALFDPCCFNCIIDLQEVIQFHVLAMVMHLYSRSLGADMNFWSSTFPCFHCQFHGLFHWNTLCRFVVVMCMIKNYWNSHFSMNVHARIDWMAVLIVFHNYKRLCFFTE